MLLTASVLPVFALTLPGDGCNAALQGLLRCVSLLPVPTGPTLCLLLDA